MGFTEVLTLIFVVCKLVGVVTWSWWLVFSPTLITAGMLLAFMLGAALLAFVSELRDIRRRR